MKRINLYLSYVAVFALFALPASADWRMNQDNNEIHVPYDANNSNNEWFFKLNEPYPNAQANNGSQQSPFARAKFSYPLDKLPAQLAELKDLYEYDHDCIILTSHPPENSPCEVRQVVGEACAITDVNGNNRNVDKFEARFTRLRPDFSDARYWEYIYLEVTMFCTDE